MTTAMSTNKSRQGSFASKPFDMTSYDLELDWVAVNGHSIVPFLHASYSPKAEDEDEAPVKHLPNLLDLQKL